MRGLRPLTTAGARRRTEALLLVFVVALTVFGHASAGLAMNGELPANLTGFTISMTLLALVGHLGVRRFAAYADPLIFPLAMLLSGLGLVLLHRLDQSYIARYGGEANAPGQLQWTVIGVAACLAVVALLRDHRLLQRFIYITMAVALVLLIAPAFFGADTYGAKRWIILFGFSLQPGEFVKIMISIFFAGYLVIHRDSLALTGRKFLGMRLPPMRQLGPIITVWIVSLLVLVFERDLGTSLIFFGVFVVMLYVATERTSWIVTGLLMAAVGAFVVGSTEPHVKGRVAAWLEPLSYYWKERPPGSSRTSPRRRCSASVRAACRGRGWGWGTRS